MGVGWAIVAFFMPGIPQLLHLDIIKAAIIWILPGATVATGGAALLAGGPIIVILGLIAFYYNISTALKY
jgi:hypothetical protein